MSVLDGPGEGTWSVFAAKVVEERDELRYKLAGEAAHIKSLEGLLVDAVRERDGLKTRLDHAEANAEQAVRNEAFNERKRIVAWIRSELANKSKNTNESFKDLVVMLDIANSIERGDHEG